MLKVGNNLAKEQPVIVDLPSLIYFTGGAVLCLLVYFSTKKEVNKKLQPVLDKINMRLEQLSQE
jgi:hypothetical protein